jgi:hypothetical protein
LSKTKEHYPEIMAEYNLAKINKVGLLFLETLASEGELERLSLEAEYEREQEKKRAQEVTISRVAEALNSIGVDYAIFKSIMPFPAVPNDVDVIHLGRRKAYVEAANKLRQSGYKEIETGRVPLCLSFHDGREGLHDDKGGKDPFDVDLYEEVSLASHVIYLTKRKFSQSTVEATVLGKNVRMLEPTVDLIAMIAHSVLEAQLYTLSLHYTTLYHLAKTGLHGANRLMSVAKANNLVFAGKVHLSLTASLEKLARGTLPDVLLGIQSELGNDKGEALALERNGFNLPHHYNVATLVRVLCEKTREREFSSSLIRQGVNMINLKEAFRIANGLILRRRRATY